MKASPIALLELLRKAPRLVIPIYQRPFSWTRAECHQLWEDIMRIGVAEGARHHFIGSVVYVAAGQGTVSTPPPLVVIDGQQRLTTLTLLLVALARVLGEETEVAGFSARRIRAYYLMNELESGDERFKLLLSAQDRDTLKAVVTAMPLPQTESTRITDAVRYFEQWLGARRTDLQAACRGICRLEVVEISLTPDDDDPQLIFESLNSTGKGLSQADLIRNFVLMRQLLVNQTDLHERYWLPMERLFAADTSGTDFDAFVRHFLTMRTREIPSQGRVYDAFRDYASRGGLGPDQVGMLLQVMLRFARHYAAITGSFLANPLPDDLRRALREFRILRANVALPFLLEVHEDYSSGIIDAQVYIRIIRLLESYLIRRAIVGVPTNALRGVFSQRLRDLDRAAPVASLEQRLTSLGGNARMPRDAEFREHFGRADLYSVAWRAQYVLHRLEVDGLREPADLETLTIEHVMPQKPGLEWQAMLGDNWEDVHERLLHTIGNLTLTGYNPEYSNRPFIEKRDLPEKGLKASRLRLNDDFKSIDKWDAEAISQRAARLADRALEIWPIPASSDRPGSRAYTLTDHANLTRPVIRELFEALEAAILGLDGRLFRDVQKYYVAYKLHRNVADVLFQTTKIKLVLNMRYDQVDDPRQMTRDVSATGTWGNGQVEITFSRLEELDDVIALVRQAYALHAA